MITFIAHMRIPQENEAAFKALMEHVCAQVREHEPGVAYYAYAKSADEPGLYVVTEVYRDAAAHASHMQTAWVRDSLPKAAGLMDGKPVIRQYVSPGTQPTQRLTS